MYRFLAETDKRSVYRIWQNKVQKWRVEQRRMPFGKPGRGAGAKSAPAGAIRLFNIDLHLAVIADVKVRCLPFGCEDESERTCTGRMYCDDGMAHSSIGAGRLSPAIWRSCAYHRLEPQLPRRLPQRRQPIWLRASAQDQVCPNLAGRKLA